MKKIIAMCRISSSKQNWDDQTNELIAYAQKDGYTLDEMEIIQDVESATKLSDEERRGLTKMYAAINDPANNIECVYCWEISRLSRKPETLYGVYRELFNIKERKKITKDTGRINLKIKNPSISLLNEQGQIDEGADIVFGLYVTLCKSEISVRVDRTRRTKTSNALKGKYNGGGRIMFGYDVDDSGYFIKKTKLGAAEKFSESEVVKTIFELYSTGKFGEYKLYRELLTLGMDLKRGNIAQILKTEEYTGEKIPVRKFTVHKGKKGKEAEKMFFARQYPAIITRELFDKCQEIRRTNSNNINKSKDNIFLCAKILKCSSCGLTMIANKNNAVYRCDNKYHVTRQRKCKCGDTIRIDAVDSIVWGLACELEIDFIRNFSQEQLEIWENEIKTLRLKIESSDKQYQTIKAKKIKRYLEDIPDATPEEQDAHAIRSTRQDKQRIDQEKVNYQVDIDRLNGLIAETKNLLNISVSENHDRDMIAADILQSDDKKRYDIVHKHIKEVTILSEPDVKGTKRIIVKFFDTQKQDEIFYYNGRVKDPSKRLYQRGDTYIGYFRYIGCDFIKKDLTREEIVARYHDDSIIDPTPFYVINEIAERENISRLDALRLLGVEVEEEEEKYEEIDGVCYYIDDSQSYNKRWYYNYPMRFERRTGKQV